MYNTCMTKNIALSDETYSKLKEIKTGSFNNTVRNLLEGSSDFEEEVRRISKEEIEKARGTRYG